jgi:Zn finger protein HypA/HybF involved in hydrogenase expression
MPADDSLLSNSTVEFREEERVFRCANPEQDWIDDQRRLQLPACDRCTEGVMDATNSHYLGLCSCECHNGGVD